MNRYITWVPFCMSGSAADVTFIGIAMFSGRLPPPSKLWICGRLKMVHEILVVSINGKGKHQSYVTMLLK